MGTLGLIKANAASIRKQEEIEAAFEAGETNTCADLIQESIVSILKAGLTPRQLGNLDELKAKNSDEIADLLSDAFDRGWWRDGQPNLSNALDEVLLAARDRIREGRARGECLNSERVFFSEPSKKRNAFFWFVIFLISSILIFRFTSGYWTIFGYLTSMMSFGALLEFLKKSNR